MMGLGAIRDAVGRWKVRAHVRRLRQVATFGEGLCASAALPATAVLGFRVTNRSCDPKRIRIGNFCNLSVSVLMEKDATIEIGDYVYWNGGGMARIVHGLKMGSRCLLGPGVTLWDTDNHPLSRGKRRAQAERVPRGVIDPHEADGGPIVIGEDVWLCMGGSGAGRRHHRGRCRRRGEFGGHAGLAADDDRRRMPGSDRGHGASLTNDVLGNRE